LRAKTEAAESSEATIEISKAARFLITIEDTQSKQSSYVELSAEDPEGAAGSFTSSSLVVSHTHQVDRQPYLETSGGDGQ